jgi:hypothetical protein
MAVEIFKTIRTLYNRLWIKEAWSDSRPGPTISAGLSSSTKAIPSFKAWDPGQFFNSRQRLAVSIVWMIGYSPPPATSPTALPAG